MSRWVDTVWGKGILTLRWTAAIRHASTQFLQGVALSRCTWSPRIVCCPWGEHLGLGSKVTHTHPRLRYPSRWRQMLRFRVGWRPPPISRRAWRGRGRGGCSMCTALQRYSPHTPFLVHTTYRCTNMLYFLMHTNNCVDTIRLQWYVRNLLWVPYMEAFNVKSQWTSQSYSLKCGNDSLIMAYSFWYGNGNVKNCCVESAFHLLIGHESQLLIKKPKK